MDLAQITQYASEAVSAIIGFFAGSALTYSVTKHNRASTGSTVNDQSNARANRDNVFGTVVQGDNVQGDKVGGDKVSAHAVTINK